MLGLGNAGVLQRFYNEIESSIGLPGSDGSLSSRIDGFETSLIEASSRPDSQPRLMAALRAAEGVASQMRAISSGIQQLRQQADTSIASAVSDLNTRLQKSQISTTTSVCKPDQGAKLQALWTNASDN